MRLVGEFQTEKQAFGFQTFLRNHGINSLYEPTKDSSDQQVIYRLWTIEEDDFDEALAYYSEWKQDPFSPRFETGSDEIPATPPSPSSSLASTHAPWRVHIDSPRARSPFSLTNFIIVICSFLFMWYASEAGVLKEKEGEIAVQYPFAPLQKRLLFDYPAYYDKIEAFFQKYNVRTVEDLKKLPSRAQMRFKQLDNEPDWKGFAGMLVTRDWDLLNRLPKETLFGKIRQGEYWRLISPVLLHGGLLHIIFNMAWLFMLGRQIEERIGKFRYLLLSLLLGIVGNVAQYLVSGPLFLGYSGIITGMVGFIWMRQRLAPWEGYPLQRSVIAFITVFVIAMFALEMISMALQFFQVTNIYANIANTAHIIGGILGMILGRLSLFARSHS